MNNVETIEGSSVPGELNLFVVGTCDKRITFYSQQVRAINLVHALVDTGRLKRHAKCAVVGGGACGIAAATALALLVPDATVHIFERGQQMLNTQLGCTRRNLHPHLYEWPSADSQNQDAGLPILNWRADSADRVAKAVLQSFATVRQAFPRIIERPLLQVFNVARNGSELDVTFKPRHEDADQHESYGFVFLTAGLPAYCGPAIVPAS